MRSNPSHQYETSLLGYSIDDVPKVLLDQRGYGQAEEVAG